MADIHTFIGRHIEMGIDIEVKIKADFDILTEDRASEINSFWIEPDTRLMECDDDARQTVVRMAAEYFINAVFAKDYVTVRAANHEFYKAEGWGDYDYNGIVLVEFDGGPDLTFHMIEIEEIENAD